MRQVDEMAAVLVACWLLGDRPYARVIGGHLFVSYVCVERIGDVRVVTHRGSACVPAGGGA